MKLMIIILCLLSERYLVHIVSMKRFKWFPNYFNAVQGHLSQSEFFSKSYSILLVVLLPLVLVSMLILWLFGSILFGLIYFLLNMVVFYYCLGPGNVFYPITAEQQEEIAAKQYFSDVNGQLFSVMFWYILAGPLVIIIYRLISLCKNQDITHHLAKQITDFFDWIPTRVTSLLYLLVGNFQKGFNFFVQYLLAHPRNNELMLQNIGELAAVSNDNDRVSLPYAQNLVEHAIIVYLVFLALFTLVAWM